MTDETEDFSLEDLDPTLQREARAYRHTNDLPREAVWSGIEFQVRAMLRAYRPAASAWGSGGWMRLAATLVLGVYLGRSSIFSPRPLPRVTDNSLSAQVQHEWKRVVVAIAGDTPQLPDLSGMLDDRSAVDDPLLAMSVGDSGIVHGVVRWTRNVVDTVLARAEMATQRIVGGGNAVKNQHNETRR